MDLYPFEYSRTTRIVIYLLRRDNLNASAVLMTFTYACSSNLRDDMFWLWICIAYLNAVWTSSVPCSNIAPGNRFRYESSYTWTQILLKFIYKVHALVKFLHIHTHIHIHILLHIIMHYITYATKLFLCSFVHL